MKKYKVEERLTNRYCVKEFKYIQESVFDVYRRNYTPIYVGIGIAVTPFILLAEYYMNSHSLLFCASGVVYLLALLVSLVEILVSSLSYPSRVFTPWIQIRTCDSLDDAIEYVENLKMSKNVYYLD